MASDDNIQSAFFSRFIPSFEVVHLQRQIVRARSILTGGPMKTRSRMIAALATIAAFAPLQAEAKGCIKGAIVGGIAGHLVGQRHPRDAADREGPEAAAGRSGAGEAAARGEAPTKTA